MPVAMSGTCMRKTEDGIEDVDASVAAESVATHPETVQSESRVDALDTSVGKRKACEVESLLSLIHI